MNPGKTLFILLLIVVFAVEAKLHKVRKNILFFVITVD